MPPTSFTQSMWIRWIADRVAIRRNAKAPTIPYRSAFFCCFRGKGSTRTARTRALSALRAASRRTRRPMVRRSAPSIEKGMGVEGYPNSQNSCLANLSSNLSVRKITRSRVGLSDTIVRVDVDVGVAGLHLGHQILDGL